MKNVLASIGIGSATVDTVLPSTAITPGETVEAEVRIEGGSTEQEVGTVRLELETRYATEDGHREADLARFAVAEGLTIEPGQEEVRDVSFDVPYHTPVTLGRVDVWVETELDIDWAVDPEDTDYVDVEPTPRMQAALDAMDDLGFSFRTAECEADPSGRYASGRAFVQEFEFRPRDGPFRGRVDEVDLVFRPGPDELTVYVEVDRRGGLLSELADADERTTSVAVRDANRLAVRDDLEDAIEERS